jgi:hypothetical protein
MSSQQALKDWLNRKLSRKREAVRRRLTVRGEVNRPLSPMGHVFAAVVLSVEPGDDFRFRSSATWPSEPSVYDDAVLDGLIDELVTQGLGPVVLNLSVHLEQIEWHQVHSSPRAVYEAARAAAKEILRSAADSGRA